MENFKEFSLNSYREEQENTSENLFNASNNSIRLSKSINSNCASLERREKTLTAHHLGNISIDCDSAYISSNGRKNAKKAEDDCNSNSSREKVNRKPVLLDDHLIDTSSYYQYDSKDGEANLHENFGRNEHAWVRL